MVVLLIVAVVFGSAIAVVALNSSERSLTNQSGEIELLAKKAHTAAILHQTPYVIEFHPTFIKLQPLSKTGDTERTTALGNEIGGSSDEQKPRTDLYETLNIDPDISLSIRYWNTQEFVRPMNEQFISWRFDPDGLCEPITVRMDLDDSYAQDTYHPLTATIADSELEAN